MQVQEACCCWTRHVRAQRIIIVVVKIIIIINSSISHRVSMAHFTNWNNHQVWRWCGHHWWGHSGRWRRCHLRTEVCLAGPSCGWTAVAHRAGAAFAVCSAAGVLEQDVSGVDYTDGSIVSLWNSETRVDRGVWSTILARGPKRLSRINTL